MDRPDAQERVAAAQKAIVLPIGVRIRSWNERDFPAIQQLSLIEGWPTPNERPDEALDCWQQSWPTLVATQDQDVIGFVRGLTDGSVTMYIAELLVAQQWRGYGIGTALLDVCHELHPRVRLDPLSTEQADRFYETAGFQRFGGFRKRYFNPVK